MRWMKTNGKLLVSLERLFFRFVDEGADFFPDIYIAFAFEKR